MPRPVSLAESALVLRAGRSGEDREKVLGAVSAERPGQAVEAGTTEFIDRD